MENGLETCSETCTCEARGTERTLKLKMDLSTRLNRVEGQIRGIKNLIDRDVYCDEVLNQISAARAALKAVSMMVLRSHMQSCLIRKIKSDDPDIIDELLITIGKMA